MTLKLLCAVNLDHISAIDCAERDGTREVPNGDIRLAKQDATLYLVTQNGASLSTAQPPTEDCSRAMYGHDRLAVAGLGPGVDLSLKTKRGSTSHVFFTNDVENESTAVHLVRNASLRNHSERVIIRLIDGSACVYRLVTDSKRPSGVNTNTLVPLIRSVPSAADAIHSARTIPWQCRTSPLRRRVMPGINRCAAPV